MAGVGDVLAIISCGPAVSQASYPVSRVVNSHRRRFERSHSLQNSLDCANKSIGGISATLHDITRYPDALVEEPNFTANMIGFMGTDLASHQLREAVVETGDRGKYVESENEQNYGGERGRRINSMANTMADEAAYYSSAPWHPVTMNGTQNRVVICVLGQTGAGKSAFILTVTQAKHVVRSQAGESSMVEAKGRRIVKHYSWQPHDRDRPSLSRRERILQPVSDQNIPLSNMKISLPFHTIRHRARIRARCSGCTTTSGKIT